MTTENKIIEAANSLLLALSKVSNWDDGCLYINHYSTPELERPIMELESAIAAATGKTAA